MPKDPQPKGFVTLHSAFLAYFSAWKEDDADLRRGQIHRAFQEGDLQAVVIIPDRAGEFVVPQETWAKGPFPARPFLADDVVEYAKDEWVPYAGRTLFVSVPLFEHWLQVNRPKAPPDPSKFDPLQVPVWSFVMAAAWVAKRSLDVVRWQMSGWRKENGIPATSLSLATEALEDEDYPHPMFFPVMPAVNALKNACIESRIVARGIASDDSRVRKLTLEDWQYGNLTFGNGMEEVWSVPGCSFLNITFLRDELLALWPALAENPVRGKTAVAGRSRRGPYRTEQRRIIQKYLDAAHGGQIPPHMGDPALVNAILTWGEKLESGVDKRLAKRVTVAQVKSFRKNAVRSSA